MIKGRNLLLFFCAFVALPVYSQQTVVEKYGQLNVVGTRIVDKNNNPVILRGISLYHSADMGNYYNENIVRWLRDDWKCTIVRSANITENYTSEMPKTKAVVNAAIKLGIYVIIDWHIVGNSNLDNALLFFDEMAKTYGHYPNILYEIWNEPTDQPWSTILKPYHEKVIARIRQYDQNNIIICGTRDWAKFVEEASMDPISSLKNIAYTLHWYAFWPNTWGGDGLRSRTSAALRNGICIFSTEGGIGTFKNTASDPGCPSDGSGYFFTEGQKWFDYCNANGISTVTWSVCNYDECTSILRPNQDNNGAGGWTESMLTESGKYMRNYLRAQNSGPVSVKSGSTITDANTRLSVAVHPGRFAEYDIRGRRINIDKHTRVQSASGHVVFLVSEKKVAIGLLQ